jgi:hypothetical protein
MRQVGIVIVISIILVVCTVRNDNLDGISEYVESFEGGNQSVYIHSG